MILTHLQLIQAFLDHLKFQKRYSQNTVIVYKDDLLAFFEYLEFQYPETPIAEIRPAFIRSWLAKLRESGKGIKELGNKSERKSAKRSTSTLPATEPLDSKSINRNISSLKSFFKYQLKQGTLPTSPMATIISPKVKKRLPQFVAEEGISTLFNYVDFPENWEGRTHLLLLQLLYNTGMRRAELISLKEAHIDKGNCNIKVLGKGNKERILPVKRQLMEMVLQYMELKRVEFEQFNGEFLLINKKGKKLYPKYVHNAVITYLSKPGVTTIDRKSPHILRHTFATHLMNNGAELNAVKELLGHSSLAATQVYTHNTIEKLKDVYSKAHPKA